MKISITTFGRITSFLMLPLLTLGGCGDDNNLDNECERACNKVVQCAADINIDISFSSCKDQCLHGPSGARDCALDCDRGLNCADYGACIVDCGFTNEQAAVQADCSDACTKLDSCANELGLDVNVSSCTDDCVSQDQQTQGCIFLCDTNDSCVDYGACVLPCGLS